MSLVTSDSPRPVLHFLKSYNPVMEHLTPANILPYAQTLYDRGSREDIVRFLQWKDPSGAWTDSASADEGLEPLTFDEALIELQEVIEELSFEKATV